jgi:hypothetical protein
VRGLWLALLTGGALFAQTAPRDLVRLSIRNGEQSWRESFDYSYVKRDVDRQMDSAGRLKSSAVDVYDIIPLGYGAFFEQQMEHDGEPLSVEERLKIARELEKRRAESPAQKRRRFEKELAERSYLEEVPDAFDFKITGEENLATGPAWVVDATPHPGYVPKSRYAHFFPKMHGTLWIDKKDLQWVKADAVAADTVTFGLFLARLAKGSHIILEQTRLPDGAWVPQSLSARAEARTFLVFNHNIDENITYSNYRKAEAITASGAAR